ncbi:MAG TPA: 16S rRNA (cytosine(967)-C(5))-methyltransferase RsmB [Lactobacillus sp.]|uniref:16S rRNA (cytosine(967)-C(5))-methyltransferase n=1 Tax=Secundilactobacillus silagincola TaxID=1714681 RepID=A0A1Z5J143_9LACO|nr:16S rRNA (cytosine(967)-C(5))-methyltransferase RsmB [Secundilactobacillus silagincola]GAX07810.1 16S rRNA methyltransferase [Secundilactobacillus silagincola]HBF75321.1 16S rRNA (cytosine(967)-C(5))-methyltransferase RsmB [Lactobacillus sp.]
MSKIDNNPRSLAVTALTRVKNGAYSNLQLNQMIDQSNMSQRDAGLMTTIVYGVIQHRLTIDYQLAPFIKNQKRVADWVMILLETAVYQMQYLERVPKRAIFDESIQIAKTRGHEGIRRFVTGVLHQMDRVGINDPADIDDPIQRQSLVYSVPEWLINALNDQLGAKKAVSVLESINHPANQSIRVATDQISMADAKAELEAEDYKVSESQVAAEGFVLKGKPANQAKLFHEGQITIQDESAMLPAESMHIKPDMMILDACSAPGGKTVQIAGQLSADDRGQVVALDIHEHKVQLVKQNAKRMHVNDRVVTQAIDARKIQDVFEDQTFDEVLVDAPCSGIGLVRRKPEIRYEKQLKDVQALSKIQLDILNAVAQKVKINGIITYSTCTILNQENRDVVAAFLADHPEFESQRVETALDLKPDRTTDYLEIYPDDYDSDGFFISQFKRVR